MNATRIVSQISIASDPAQINDAAPGGSLNSAGRGQDFAATLSNVGAKSARRQAAGKAHDGAQSGGSLPTPGNLSPPPANAAMTAASTANPPAAGTAASANAAANMTTPPNTTLPGNGSAAGRDAAALRGEATKIEAASSAAALGAAAAGGADTDPLAGPASMAADGRSGGAISGAQGQAALGPDAVLNSAASAPGSAAAAEPGADFAQAFGLPGAVAAGGAQTAADADAMDKASAAKSAKEIPEAAGGRLPRVRAGGAAETVVASAGRTDSAANTATLPAVGSSDDTASTTVPGDSARDGGATLQTVIAAASSAAAVAAGVSSGASAEPQADDSAGPAAVGAAARPAGRAGGLLEPPAPIVVPAAAATAARAAAGAEGAAALANSVESDKHAHGGSADSLTSTDANGIAGAAGLGPNATASTDAVPTPTLKVAAGVDTPEFGSALADRVSWMVGNNLNGAKLQVNPSQLGPIEVRIAVQGAHAQVWLASHSAVTRDALESSSQKLREMLGAQGFGQVSVDISQRSFHERSPQAQAYDWTPSADSVASPASMSPSARPAHFSSSAVDAYA